MLAIRFENVSDCLFVGEAKLFLKHPRCARRTPYRMGTASAGPDKRQSFTVRVFNSNMVMLCDSRMNTTRVVQKMEASDIGGAHDVGVLAAGCAGRWSNLFETSDGRHWSEGEEKLIPPRPTCNVSNRMARLEETALSALLSQLPPDSAEAVRDGRAIVIGRTESILNDIWGDARGRDDVSKHGMRVVHLCKAFKTNVFALCRAAPSGTPEMDGAVAILFAGAFWPKDGGVKCSSTGAHRPSLTVARRQSIVGGSVFCICVGTHFANSLAGMSPEEIAISRRHYEGCFSEADCRDLLSTNDDNKRRQVKSKRGDNE